MLSLLQFGARHYPSRVELWSSPSHHRQEFRDNYLYLEVGEHPGNDEVTVHWGMYGRACRLDGPLTVRKVDENRLKIETTGYPQADMWFPSEALRDRAYSEVNKVAENRASALAETKEKVSQK